MGSETVVAEQLPLGHVVADAFASAGDALMRAVAEAVGASGKVTDDLAIDLGVDPAQFSRAIRGKGAHFAVRWLPAIVYRDRSHIIVRHLCHLAGGEFIERPKMTPEQKLARLEKVLAEAGPFGKAVRDAAFGEDA